MKNSITASIEFSFKGKSFSPSITIELDSYLTNGRNFPNLVQIIAKQNNFDMYSYEYEVMQDQVITYSNATGFVAEFITDGNLDIAAFETAWYENNALEKLLLIAEEYMNITEFSQHIELKKALLDAYELGKKEGALSTQRAQQIVESF